MRKSNQETADLMKKSGDNMVKGRVRNRNISTVTSGKEIIPLMKRETNTNGFKRRQRNALNGMQAISNEQVSSACITAFFPIKVANITNVNTTKESSKDVDVMTGHCFLTKEETISISVVEEIVTDVGEFKTDETPVAVPIHGPSTPHRINMPNSHVEETDSRDIINGRNKGLVATCTPPQHLARKPARRKLTQSQNNAQRSVHSSVIEGTNHTLAEYFPVRRSVRKSKKAVLEEKQRDIEAKVLQQVEEGLEVRHFPGKGRGVVTTRSFMKGEFVVEYIGELIDQVIAKKREKIYAQDQNAGCYMYYFQHRNHQYCVDATAETKKLGRLVNHSRNGNLIARIVEVESTPHLVLTAKEDIPIGVEVTYDYGDRSREAIRHHPWLAL
ncbi:histone-lysine N-methyltransferase pr-set7 [Vespula maculifrons]|uniref:[histone H4]-lysine(20) N-methyltransferase n=1 Tax=Vespula maculifrons TaxID=7453 RepID=A0ABD2D1E7_VESMC